MTQQEALQLHDTKAVYATRFAACWDIGHDSLRLDVCEFRGEPACLWTVWKDADYIAGGKIDHPLHIASLVAVNELSRLAKQETR